MGAHGRWVSSKNKGEESASQGARGRRHKTGRAGIVPGFRPVSEAYVHTRFFALGAGQPIPVASLIGDETATPRRSCVIARNRLPLKSSSPYQQSPKPCNHFGAGFLGSRQCYLSMILLPLQ